MEFDSLSSINRPLAREDVYTNLQGLQGIKNIEDQDAALKKVAQQFESLFMNMVMKSMRAANAVFEEDSIFSSKETQFYRDMLDQQRGLSLSTGRGIGIAEALYRQMSDRYGATRGHNDSGSQKIDSSLQRKESSFDITGQKTTSDLSLARARVTTKDVPVSVAEKAKDDIKTSTENKITFAQSPKDFVDSIAPYAKKAAEALGVDHMMLVAQSALETGWGKYVLSDKRGGSSLNLFNIKARSDEKIPAAEHTTLEFSDGVFKKEQANFKVYNSVRESFDDYVDLLMNNSRYEGAVNANGDNERYIKALHSAGYATDPEYSEKVLAVYNQIRTDVSAEENSIFEDNQS